MASIKVKFRKSTVKGRPGKIYYQICHRRQLKTIQTKMSVLPEEWNGDGRYNAIYTLNIHYNQLIENDVRTLRSIIQEFEYEQISYTAADIVERYQSGTSTTILDYMRRQITILQKKKKYGTADNYRCSLRSMEQFLNHHDIPFTQLNSRMVNNYNEWLEERNVKRNSISFYMRVWRAVYNKAVQDEIIIQKYPFRGVYTGIEHTAKRAVPEDIIMQLARLDLKERPSLCMARDLFIFSYCTRGMAFIDIAFLKKDNIQNGMLTYTRRKTGQELSILIEPCIQNIINKYKKYTETSDYLFPILTATDEKEALQQYHTALNYHNRKLKKLAQKAGITPHLTSYTSRHSWATTARDHNIPLSVISAGMGHTSEKTTEIYLATLQNSVIDNANKNVLKKLNRYISC